MTENIQIQNAGTGLWSRRLLSTESQIELTKKWVFRSAALALLALNYYFFHVEILELVDESPLNFFSELAEDLAIFWVLSAIIMAIIYFFFYWFLVRRDYWNCLKSYFKFLFFYFPYAFLVFCLPGVLTPESNTCPGPDPYESCGPVKGFFNQQKRVFKGLSGDEARYLMAQTLKETGNEQWFGKSKTRVFFTQKGGSTFGGEKPTINLQITQPYSEIKKAFLHEAGHAYFLKTICPAAKAKGMARSCERVLKGERNISYSIRTETYAECWEGGDTASCNSESYLKALFKPINSKGSNVSYFQSYQITRFYESYDVRGYAWVNHNKPNIKYYFRNWTKWEMPLLDALGAKDQFDPEVID